MIDCPPKFRYACIDLDGEKCPFYHDGRCVQVEVEAEAARQGIPTQIDDSARIRRLKPEHVARVREVLEKGGPYELRDEWFEDSVECVETIEQEFGDKLRGRSR